MKQLDQGTWRRRTVAVVSVVLLLALSAHPELFSVGTLVDALGIDGLWLLLELQLVGVLLPMLLTGLAWCMPYLRPVGRAIGNFLRDCGGPVGQYGYLWLTTRTRAR